MGRRLSSRAAAGHRLDRIRLIGPAVTYWSELAEAGDRILGRGHPDALTARARLAEAYLATGQVAGRSPGSGGC